MFKDYHKYLRVSLKVYLFVLVLVFIMKMVGLDYFGLDVNNPVMIKLNNIVWHFKIREIWYIFTLWLYAYLIISIVSNNKKVKGIALIITIIDVICILTIKYQMVKIFRSIFDILILYIACFIASKNSFKTVLKKTTFWIFMYTLFQCISMITRKGNMQIIQEDFVSLFILNFDYILLMLITHKLYFMEGGIKLCGTEEVGLSSLKKINLSTLLKRLQRNLHNFKALDKETKLTYIIYFVLSLIWNALTIIIILLFAKLNGTIIECLFILTSFWLSKRVFGKPFHLPSMKQCFIVSNLTYYILNRITTPLGISILIPIMLGVGLSYITSKLVNKTHRTLYKGMPKEKFEERILKVAEKDSIRYKVCYDFFINKENAIYLASKYNYTEAGIRQIIYMVKKEIKA